MAMACACGACVYVFYANVGKETKRLCCKEIIKKMISGFFLFFFLGRLCVQHLLRSLLCNVGLIGSYDVSDAYYLLIRDKIRSCAHFKVWPAVETDIFL